MKGMEGTTRRVRFLVSAAGAVLAAVLLLGGYFAYSLSRIPYLFRLNKACQEEGYYMGEFEFKMLGLAYYLDKGQLLTAAARINTLHRQLRTRDGLIAVPSFADAEEELQFFLGLQNPRTGAFMDDAYPYMTFEGPTGNVLLHLEALAKKAGKPLRLRYPMLFFDQIATPETLRPFLDDVANIGPLAAKLPESSFHMARDLVAYCRPDNVLERNGLYAFSPAWKRALLGWFYDNQDPETGFWGPRSRWTGKLLKADMSNTASIIQGFVDRSGNALHPEYPLRHTDRMIGTTITLLSRPMPAADAEDELHAWALAEDKGIKMLVRYLWKNASAEQKRRTRELIEEYVRVKFEKYYVDRDGAFGYYPGAAGASLDGTGGTIGLLRDIGAFSRTRQEALWGSANSLRSEVLRVDRIGEREFAVFRGNPAINAVRIYAPSPASDNPAAGVAAVFYPRATPCLDAADLLPRVASWLSATDKSMGNWVSRETVLEETELRGVNTAPQIVGDHPVGVANELFGRRGELVVVGFNTLQLALHEIRFSR
jgi:hypothetical protein